MLQALAVIVALAGVGVLCLCKLLLAGTFCLYYGKVMTLLENSVKSSASASKPSTWVGYAMVCAQ